MAMGPGVAGPNPYQPRDVKRRPQGNGRVWNTSGKVEIGETKWRGPAAMAKVEKPTGMKVSRSTSQGMGD